MSPSLVIQRVVDSAAPPVEAVVFVRTYGVQLNPGELFAKLRRIKPDLLIVDDRCLAAPETELERDQFHGADVLLYSTGYGKQVDLGFGGFAHLQREIRYTISSREFKPDDLAKVTNLWNDHIRTAQPIFRGDGASSRLLADMLWLDTRPPNVDWRGYANTVVEKRAESEIQKDRINEIYQQQIHTEVQMPNRFNRWRFQILIPDRDEALREIFEAGLFASGHFFPASILFGGICCPEATRLHSRVLNLFNDHRISDSQANRLSFLVKRHVDGRVIGA